MIITVNFMKTVTCLEPWPGGTDGWRAGDEAHKPYEMTCEDKGNAVVFAWTSKAQKRQGRRMRVRIPLTNIAEVLEDLDDKPAKEKP